MNFVNMTITSTSSVHRLSGRQRMAEEVLFHRGQVDWDEPFDRAHRGVNVGREPYEEVTIFFLDDEHADRQPRADVEVAKEIGGVG